MPLVNTMRSLNRSDIVVFVIKRRKRSGDQIVTADQLNLLINEVEAEQSRRMSKNVDYVFERHGWSRDQQLTTHQLNLFSKEVLQLGSKSC